MASFYGPRYEQIWTQALIESPATDLWTSAVAEVSDFFSISPEEASQRLSSTWAGKGSMPFPAHSSEAVEDFYRGDVEGLYMGMYWHSLRADTWSLVGVAALHAIERYSDGTSVLDFGSGVGSMGLLLSKHGFEPTLFDLSQPMNEFANWRFDRRGLKGNFATAIEDAPGPFDAIVSLDVLEHLTQPLEAVKLMASLLKPGGILVLNIAFGLDPNVPQHILAHRRGCLDKIRQLGFQRASSADPLVYYRTAGRRSTIFAGLADLADATWGDVNASNKRWVAGPASRLRTWAPPSLLPGRDAREGDEPAG